MIRPCRSTARSRRSELRRLPVLTYVRGYDGQTRLIEAVSFSNPNLPSLSPVRYPTVGNYYYGPRNIQTTPWGTNAINWIDQN